MRARNESLFNLRRPTLGRSAVAAGLSGGCKLLALLVTVTLAVASASGGLRGVVGDLGGRPLTGALVSAVNTSNRLLVVHTNTASDGTYALVVEPGEYVCSASNPGYLPQTLMPLVIDSNQTIVNFGLPPVPALSNAFYVLVSAGLHAALTGDLSAYTNDVAQQGYKPVVISTVADTPLRLRTLLQSAWTRGMAGCLLVGDFPVAMYHEQVPGGQYCASDLFYSDLDGTWTDLQPDGAYHEHTGRRGPDIIFGRLTASRLRLGPEDDEISLLRNYFRKLRGYRTAQRQRPPSACLFVDAPWAHSAPDYLDYLSNAYPNIILFLPPNNTGEAYRQCLTNDVETVQVHTHASSDGHALDPWVSSADIRNLDPRPLFYVIMGCYAADYRASNYLAGWYVFSPTSTLLAIGETFSGGVAGLESLYQPLAAGMSWGESCKLKASPDGEQILATSIYAETLLGDPTLRIQSQRPPEMVSVLVSLEEPERIRISWRAITRSHASLKYYHVQFRSDAEPWRELATNLRTSTLVFAAPPQHTYTFRCRAVDYAGIPGAALESSPLYVPDTDSDGNRLPDTWEVRYFGHTGVNPADDSDGDGASNLDEYRADTHPCNAADVLRVLDYRLARQGSLAVATISWASKPGRCYLLQQSEDVNPGGWQPSGPGLVVAEGPITTCDLSASPSARQFFRVMLPW